MGAGIGASYPGIEASGSSFGRADARFRGGAPIADRGVLVSRKIGFDLFAYQLEGRRFRRTAQFLLGSASAGLGDGIYVRVIGQPG
jgi:hypothetical protein